MHAVLSARSRGGPALPLQCVLHVAHHVLRALRLSKRGLCSRRRFNSCLESAVTPRPAGSSSSCGCNLWSRTFAKCQLISPSAQLCRLAAALVRHAGCRLSRHLSVYATAIAYRQACRVADVGAIASPNVESMGPPSSGLVWTVAFRTAS